jgi:acyl-coenzyme A thioesterase PaaI-like protein
VILGALPVSGCQDDLEFVDLVPLGVGTLSVRNRQKLLQALTGRSGLRFIHGGIISSFANHSMNRAKLYH